ncbi:N-acetylmuramoyl-L-alanine amidase [uncultured Muribaculum sp.]|uniref:N-acetylmuramoyl-L-alanine amidase n=1 Tax=Muribaculaceae TaxID=2005473 RepID=UPI00346365CA
MMKILIDNGHGEETPGKCSPDKRLREYQYCREIAQRVSGELTLKGADTLLLVPEKTDISLNERVRRVNGWSNKLGSKNVVLVSIHNNAAGADGKWHNASGFSVFVSQNASTNSKRLAQIFTDKATEMNLTGNRCIPKEKYWVQSLAMTRDTNCPAVLTENLFQDNEEDVAYLLSEEGKRAIVKLHVDSIIDYINTL